MQKQFVTRFKPSGELLSYRRTEELYAKQEDYIGAHNAKLKREELETTERERYAMVCENRLKQMTATLRARHQTEVSAFRHKLSQWIEEHKKSS